MKVLKQIFLAAGLLILANRSVFAQSAGDQGYGLMLGIPTGLTGKIWLDDEIAIDGALGIESSDLDVHLSFLWHDYGMLKRLNIQQANWDADVPIYYGVGPRIRFKGDTEFGARFPVGISVLPH